MSAAVAQRPAIALPRSPRTARAGQGPQGGVRHAADPAERGVAARLQPVRDDDRRDLAPGRGHRLLHEVRARLAHRPDLHRHGRDRGGLHRDRRGRADRRGTAVLVAAVGPRDRRDPADQAGDRQRRRVQRRGVRPLHRLTPRAAAHQDQGEIPEPERGARARLRLTQIRAPLPRPRADSHRRGPTSRGRGLPRGVQRDPAARSPRLPSAGRDPARPPSYTRSTSIKPEISCQKLDAGQLAAPSFRPRR